MYDYDVPFFREWFRPVFELAGRRTAGMLGKHEKAAVLPAA